MPTMWLSDFLKENYKMPIGLSDFTEENHEMPETDPYDSWDEPYDTGNEITLKGRLYMLVNSEETYTPDHILKSNNVTIVFWKDGTKTVVKRNWKDAPNNYNAFCAALAIKIFGSNSHLKKMLDDNTFVQVKSENGKAKMIKKKDLHES